MRGVYIRVFEESPPATGSSPHARGLLGLIGGDVLNERIIPACAGFTRATSTTSILTGIIPACAGFTVMTVRCGTSRSDHPRMRGVYKCAVITFDLNSGSSPHARGLLMGEYTLELRERIIPACAGFTSAIRETMRACSDHPRMRGVYPSAPSATGTLLGSSPHARGLHHHALTFFVIDGIIPACAGFTSPRPWSRPGPRDHPRMRGVYGPESSSPPGTGGSSPHARGLHQVLQTVGVHGRIIPACAGFTPVAEPGDFGHEDHPRMRGVYPAHDESFQGDGGSSPHARGLPTPRSVGRVRLRIIPACAGFTAARWVRRESARDHPRMRGVYVPTTTRAEHAEGSSPHARGLPALTTIPDDTIGIIPACAGFTPPPSASPPWSADHPRMRGVYRTLTPDTLTRSGSSPHARGLLELDGLEPVALGIIPACAGFTS